MSRARKCLVDLGDEVGNEVDTGDVVRVVVAGSWADGDDFVTVADPLELLATRTLDIPAA